MNKEHTCINCQNLDYNKHIGEHYCKAWSHGGLPEQRSYDITVVNWPDEQSCGVEDVGPGTGKFLSKKAHDRSQKLKTIGI
jgi:hypothetical protein